MKEKTLTLAQFSIRIPLDCFHCGDRLPKSAQVERNGKYVIVLCPKCQLMTPFTLEAA